MSIRDIEGRTGRVSNAADDVYRNEATLNNKSIAFYSVFRYWTSSMINRLTLQAIFAMPTLPLKPSLEHDGSFKAAGHISAALKHMSSTILIYLCTCTQ